MPKPIVTMHELETTKWTLDRLEEATPDQIENTRRYIVRSSSGQHRKVYHAFFSRLLEDVRTVKEQK